MKNCISRFCLLALLLLMTIAPVRAEIIGQTTENEYGAAIHPQKKRKFLHRLKWQCLQITDVCVIMKMVIYDSYYFQIRMRQDARRIFHSG